MPKITIGAEIIDFPNTGTDAVWSEAVVDFAVATADALGGLTSTYDISPKKEDLSNVTTLQSIPNGSGFVNFPSGLIRSFIFTYSISRKKTDGAYIAETGNVYGVYNIDSNPSIGGWKLNYQFDGEKLADGTFYHYFQMSGDTLQIKLENINASDTPEISFYAKTLLKVY